MIAASSVLESGEQTTKIIQMQQRYISTALAAWCQQKKQAIFNKDDGVDANKTNRLPQDNW